MKTRMKVYYLSLVLLLAGSVGVKAQMTIGSSEPPHEGALLDLQQPNASTKMGLKLPVVSLADASLYGLTSGDQTKAVGMVVYNDNADIANGHGAGVYVWNGTKWSSLLGTGGSTGEEPADGTVLCAGLTFMDRNLGADPTADPNPSSYDAETTASPTGSLNGDYFQWGRKADGHEKWNSPAAVGPVTVDHYGQVPATNGAYYGKFIWNAHEKDWRSTHDDDLWEPSYHLTSNPCPNGFRIPTKTEWADVIKSILPFNKAAFTAARQGINIGSYGLFLPAAGFRDGLREGWYIGKGISTAYWSNTGIADMASIFTISIGYNATDSWISKSAGCNVRCVKN